MKAEGSRIQLARYHRNDAFPTNGISRRTNQRRVEKAFFLTRENCADRGDGGLMGYQGLVRVVVFGNLPLLCRCACRKKGALRTFWFLVLVFFFGVLDTTKTRCFSLLWKRGCRSRRCGNRRAGKEPTTGTVKRLTKEVKRELKNSSHNTLHLRVNSDASTWWWGGGESNLFFD